MNHDLISIPSTDMKSSWNARALSDPLYYIISSSDANDIRTFNRTGLCGANAIMDIASPLLQNLDVVLDIGCGIGRVLQFIAPCFTKAYGIDVADEYIKQSKVFLKHITNTETMISDGLTIPSEIHDNSVDLIYSVLVFNHIPLYETAQSIMHSVHRVLKPNGIMILQIGITELPSKKDRIPNTWNGIDWTIELIEKMITKASLKIIKTNTNYYNKIQDLWIIVTKS